MHVHRGEEGLEHLEEHCSEEVCHISCFLLFAFTSYRQAVSVCVSVCARVNHRLLDLSVYFRQR